MRLLDTPLMRPRLASDARDAKRRGIERRKGWRRIGSTQTGHKAAAPFAKEQTQHARTQLNSADSGVRRANPSPPPQTTGRHPRAPTPGDFFTPATIFQTGVVFTPPISSDMLKDLARSCEMRRVGGISAQARALMTSERGHRCAQPLHALMNANNAPDGSPSHGKTAKHAARERPRYRRDTNLSKVWARFCSRFAHGFAHQRKEVNRLSR